MKNKTKYVQVKVAFEDGYLINDGSDSFILQIRKQEFQSSKEWLIEIKESIEDFLKGIENKEVYK